MGWRISIAGEKDLTIYVEHLSACSHSDIKRHGRDFLPCSVLCRKSRKIKQHPRRTDVVLAAILDFLQEIRDTVKN